MSTSSTTTRIILTAGLIVLAAMAGCRGDRSRERPRQFIPDMDDSPKFKPQTQSGFFEDGRVMRRPVAGTVPFGSSLDPKAADRAGFLKEDTGYFFGKGSDGKYLDRIPALVVVDKALIERGQERFNIYCSACHGYDGKGKGQVGQQWAVPLPNFHDPKYTDLKADQGKDGYIFHTIRNGVPDANGNLKMPSYGYSVNERDAWAIVAYFRTLQATQMGSLDDLTPAQREALKATRAAEIEKIQKAAEAAKNAAEKK